MFGSHSFFWNYLRSSFEVHALGVFPPRFALWKNKVRSAFEL